MDFDPRVLKDAIHALRTLVRTTPGAHATIIGGLAVQEHGFQRWTEDVDVVVDALTYATISDGLRASGYDLTPKAVFIHKQSGAQIDLLREGTLLKNARFPLPHPSELGPNMGFATLPALIRLKLDAGGRMKDQLDIVELLKRYPDRIHALASSVPAELLSEFERLAEQARKELQ